MKTLSFLLPAAMLAMGGFLFVPATANAQAPAPAGAANQQEVLVKITKVNVGVQKTPKIQAEGTTDKRWKPKDWLEIEVDCEALPSKKVRGTGPAPLTYPEVTIKFYVYLEGQSKEKSRILTGESVHANVPIKEAGHSVMYVHPSTILSLTGKAEGNANAVKYWGIEVLIGGEMVGYDVKPGSPGSAKEPWWNMAGAPSKEVGLKKKSETPFSVLWADYHYDERGK